MTEAEKAVSVHIEGRVQGVGFRMRAREEATRRGLRGWVRNRRDGSVEALFVGPSALVDEMVRRCRRGPSTARIESVDVAIAKDDGCVGFVDAPNV